MSVVLISLNPCEWLTNPPYGAYRDQPFDPNKPHPYALAELAFQQLSLAHSQAAAARAAGGRAAESLVVNQSIIISGESGAGKTETAKMILPYLTTAGAAATGSVLDKRIVQTNPVFESFGNAKTLRNHNSSRFGKLITLRYAPAAGVDRLELHSARLETYLLERSRVTAPSRGERNFHAFYQLLEADPAVTSTARRLGARAAPAPPRTPPPPRLHSPRWLTVCVLRRNQVGLAGQRAGNFEWLAATGCIVDPRLPDASLWRETEVGLADC